MMDDTISRQAALKAVSFDTEAYMAINMLPSAQQWIPCSERLPEDGQKVLVSSKDGIYVAMLNAPWYGDWYEIAEFRTLNVVSAWMSLPEPYKQEENR